MPDRLYFTDSDEANALIASDPLALLVGFALDQQITVQHAFLGPLTLKERLGKFDADTLAAAFSGVKSCLFDLNNPDGTGKPIKVDTTLLNKAQILVCPKADPATGFCPSSTMPVPLDNTNGWKVNCVPAGDPSCTPTQLELTGSSCDNWRLPDNNHIDFDFPCGVIVPG